jgi:hypothetical protein
MQQHPTSTLELSDFTPSADPDESDNLRIVTMTVVITDDEGNTQVWDNLPLDPAHVRAGSPDAFSKRFAQKPSNLAQARTLPIVIELGDDTESGLDVIAALASANSSLLTELNDLKSSDTERSVDIVLAGGNDGERPTSSEYEGTADEDKNIRTGQSLRGDRGYQHRRCARITMVTRTAIAAMPPRSGAC